GVGDLLVPRVVSREERLAEECRHGAVFQLLQPECGPASGPVLPPQAGEQSSETCKREHENNTSCVAWPQGGPRVMDDGIGAPAPLVAAAGGQGLSGAAAAGTGFRVTGAQGRGEEHRAARGLTCRNGSPPATGAFRCDGKGARVTDGQFGGRGLLPTRDDGGDCGGTFRRRDAGRKGKALASPGQESNA